MLEHLPPQASHALDTLGPLPSDGVIIENVQPQDMASVYWLSRHGSFSDVSASRTACPLDGAICGEPLGWVAKIDGRVVGFAAGWEQCGDVAHVCRIAVHDQFHGFGIGLQLARAALNSLRDHGCLKVVLHHVASPSNAVDLMERSGFVFNRSRNQQEDPCLEFYLDLYTRPNSHSNRLFIDG